MSLEFEKDFGNTDSQKREIHFEMQYYISNVFLFWNLVSWIQL